MACRLFRKARLLTRPTPARQDAPFRRQGRSERRGDAYSMPYVEPLSDARTPLADFIDSLLASCHRHELVGFIQRRHFDDFDIPSVGQMEGIPVN